MGRHHYVFLPAALLFGMLFPARLFSPSPPSSPSFTGWPIATCISCPVTLCVQRCPGCSAHIVLDCSPDTQDPVFLMLHREPLPGVHRSPPWVHPPEGRAMSSVHIPRPEGVICGWSGVGQRLGREQLGTGPGPAGRKGRPEGTPCFEPSRTPPCPQEVIQTPQSLRWGSFLSTLHLLPLLLASLSNWHSRPTKRLPSPDNLPYSRITSSLPDPLPSLCSLRVSTRIHHAPVSPRHPGLGSAHSRLLGSTCWG